MQDDAKNNEIEQKDDAENNTSITRRRFTQASMVAPVVMSLASRPVLGQVNQCTTSGLESGNHSGVAEVQCEGCSPGYWKQSQHVNSWVIYSPTDIFSTVFGITDTNHIYAGLTLLQVLQKVRKDSANLGFQTVAALLNAAALGPGTARETFGYTPFQVIELYNNFSVSSLCFISCLIFLRRRRKKDFLYLCSSVQIRVPIVLLLKI